jgi:hypothetical protein
MENIFKMYKEKDEYDSYEFMTCPICKFKKFRFVFSLNHHCKKIHNMSLKDALNYRMNKMSSLNKRISYVAYGLSYRGNSV